MRTFAVEIRRIRAMVGLRLPKPEMIKKLLRDEPAILAALIWGSAGIRFGIVVVAPDECRSGMREHSSATRRYGSPRLYMMRLRRVMGQ